jgi:hypothetical protein
MTLDSTMPASFRAALDAALSRPLLLDPRALAPVRGAAGFRPRASRDGAEGAAPEPFERDGDVAVVSITGPLSQRAWSCWMFEGDGYDAIVQRVARLASDGGLCRGIQITNGSVGLSTARLWKGEVGMVVIRMSHVTPWDMAPIIGISKRLGCLFLRPNRAGTRLIQAHLVPVNTVQEQTSELVIVHQSRWDELKRWQEEKV